MSASHRHDIAVPKPPLLAIGALLLFTLAATAVYRYLSDGSSPTAPTAAVVAERQLRFADRPDGGITVQQVPGDSVVMEIAPGAQPFIRGALRALVRERRSMGMGAAPPFLLQARSDGRLTLTDTGTGRRLDIESFGPAQSAAFAQLLPRPAPRNVVAQAGAQ